MTNEELIEKVNALPAHWPEGYEWEWGCNVWGPNDRVRPSEERCPGEAQHNDDLISRDAVLKLIGELR